MVTKAKKTPTPLDYMDFSMWRYDDSEDVYHPVVVESDVPESERDLSIRACFETPSGRLLDGYVVGITRIFSIGLFAGGEIYFVNKNLPDLSEKQMEAYIESQPEFSSIRARDLFPLKYRTMMNQGPYTDFSGTFEMIWSD